MNFKFLRGGSYFGANRGNLDVEEMDDDARTLCRYSSLCLVVALLRPPETVKPFLVFVTQAVPGDGKIQICHVRENVWMITLLLMLLKFMFYFYCAPKSAPNIKHNCTYPPLH